MFFYCDLCGNDNLEFLPFCLRCGLPKNKWHYKVGVKGWESCEIVAIQLEQIGADQERVCFVAEIMTSDSKYYTHPSDPFVRKIWSQWEDEPPPPLTDKEHELLQKMRKTLRAEGWHDTIASSGEPTYRFWHRRKRSSGRGSP
jgi:hypothetical protein